jgi:DNA-directed RNA polymerase subunit RPC12/RpoP
MSRTRTCPACKEKAPYDRRRDFRDADKSDETYTYKECRLCGHKHEIKPRLTQKKQAKFAKQDELNKLMDELLLGKKKTVVVGGEE